MPSGTLTRFDDKNTEDLMARKPAAPATQELPPAMDYAQHEGTYRGFLAFVKWGCISMAFVVLALYAFIEGQAPLMGVVLLVLSVAVPIAGVLMGGRKRTTT
jgi:hypothetical protein